MEKILKKIKNKKAVIGIVGLGYVGLPLCEILLKKGYHVIGYDIDKKKINDLYKKRIYITNFNPTNIFKEINKKFLVRNVDNTISKLDIIIICVPTPLKQNIPDLSPLNNSMKSIKKYLKKDQTLIIESSTYPGTTDLLYKKYIKKSFNLGKNFFIGYSPEREDPGNKKFKISNTPKIVSGKTKNCLKIVNYFYKNFINKTHIVSSIEIAEFTKLYENTYRNINIALANEAKILSEKLNLDIFEIIKAAKTKPFGFQAFYPGPGIGGHCIPVDPIYLSWLAKSKGVKTDFINLAAKINNSMPLWIIKIIKKKLNLNSDEFNKKKFLLVGAAYKKNVNDLRESPILKIVNYFTKNKINFDYNDEFIKKIETKKFKHKFYSVKLSSKLIKRYDIVILLTDHDYLNSNLLLKNSKIIFDLRNFFKKRHKNVIGI